MALGPDFLDAMLPIREIQVAGTPQPSENIDFQSGFSVTQTTDADGSTTTHVAASGGLVPITAHDTDAVFPGLGGKDALVVFEALSADRTCPIPTLADGQAVTIRDRDNSLAAHDIIVTASVAIRIGGVSHASPYHMSVSDYAPGSSLKLVKVGSELVSVP